MVESVHRRSVDSRDRYIEIGVLHNSDTAESYEISLSFVKGDIICIQTHTHTESQTDSEREREDRRGIFNF